MNIIMLKRVFIPLLIPVLFACNQPAKQASTTTDSDTTAAADTGTFVKEIPADQLIVPGRSIGHLVIGSATDSVIAVLGKPDGGDAAMGSSLAYWDGKGESKGYRTSVFSHRNMGGKDENTNRIKQVRVTSPWFKTIEGTATGLTLQQISEHYNLKPVTTYKQLKVYDDVNAGIAFDIDSVSKKCVGIIVHVPKDTVGAYLNIRE
jgi:hypothetical protein